MNEGKAPRPAAALAALLALTGLNLFNYLDRQVLPAVLTPIKSELHLSDGSLGTLQTAFMFGYFLTSPIFGYLGDRFRRKGLIAAGVLVWSVGTILSGRAHGFTELLLFRVLVGLGEASYGTVSPAWIADLYPARRRNWALSVFYVAIPVGSALGYLLGGLVASHYGWRAAFWCAGAPGLLLALGLLALPEPARGAADAAEFARPQVGMGVPPVRSLRTSGEFARTGGTPVPTCGVMNSPDSAFQAYRQLLRSPAYLLVVAGYVAQTFALGGFAFWAPTFLQRTHGMSLAGANFFFGTSLVLTGLTATLLGGWAGTAWQKRSPAGYAWLLAGSAAAAVPAAFASFLLPGLPAAKGALVAAMFLLFLSTGPVNTLILETVPAARRASAMAASIFAIHLFGDLWSPKLAGMLSDRLGDLRTALCWTLPGAVAVCALCWFWLAAVMARKRPL